MKRILITLIAVNLVSACPLSLKAISTSSISSEGQVIVDTVHSPSLEGNLLGDSPDRNVMIYLPPGYDDSPDKYYPVVYLLPPITTDASFWFGGSTTNKIDVKQIMDDLISQEAIIPMIIVSPDSKNKYGGGCYANSYVTGNWEDFLVDDIVQYVDNTFRTLPQSGSRGIAGYSNTGACVIKLAMKHPDVFSLVYSLSASPMLVMEDAIIGDWEDPTIIALNGCDNFESLNWKIQAAIARAAAFAPNSSLPCLGELPLSADKVLIDSVWEKYLLHDPYTMLPTYKDSMLQLRAIKMEAGTEGDVSYSPTLRFSQAMTNNGINHVLDSFPGDHVNMRAERVEKSLFPFFSSTLSKNMLDDTVPVPDTAFLYALIDEGVDIDGDSVITYGEAESVHILDISYKNIDDVTGLEAFINIDTLNCQTNSISTLILSYFQSLMSLNANDNNLSGIDVSENPHLTELKVNKTNLTALDVTNNPELRMLVFNKNQINTIDVSKNPGLEYLVFNYNPIGTLDISNNPDLIMLRGRGTHLCSLDISNNELLSDGSIWIDSCNYLHRVCVWDGFTTGANIVDNESPHVHYTTECDDNIKPEFDTVFHDKTNNILKITINEDGMVYLVPLDTKGNIIDIFDSALANIIVNAGLEESLDLSAAGNDEFWIYAIDLHGNVSDSLSKSMISSIPEEYVKNPFKIYPNPAKEMIFIETLKPDHHSIEITSLNGQLIYQGEMEGITHQIDISPFSKGVYFIMVRSRDQVWTEKIIKL